jgi:hypothetical protein
MDSIRMTNSGPACGGACGPVRETPPPLEV